jgi:hypothetical protein
MSSPCRRRNNDSRRTSLNFWRKKRPGDILLSPRARIWPCEKPGKRVSTASRYDDTRKENSSNPALELVHARVAASGTKTLALSGRTFDMAGPGGQQENFHLSSRRGCAPAVGCPVSVSHLWSIVGLEELDPKFLSEP